MHGSWSLKGLGHAMHRVGATLLIAASMGAGASPALAETVGSIDIVHINDIHGHHAVTYGDGADGAEIGINAFSALKRVIEEVDPVFALDAGDTFHGDSFATVNRGAAIAELLDEAGVDATTPGNHDWSYGAGRLDELDGDHGFAVLAANVVDAATGERYFEEPYLLREVALEDGRGDLPPTTVSVGVFGVIDEDFLASTPAGNVSGLDFADAAETADTMAETLREQGADIVICLSHNEDPQALAAQTSGIDAVVSGHEHIAIDDTVTSADGSEVAVVEVPSSPAADYFGTVGVLTLDVSADSAGEYVVEGHTEEQIATADPVYADTDERIAATTARILAENAEILDEVVGTSEGDYPFSTTDAPGGWELIRTQDEPIGHLVTGAYLAQTGADLAFENAGGIRGGVAAGDVTAGDLIAISPYGNTLSTYRLTGAEVRAAIERSLDISRACRDVLAKQIDAIENGEDPYRYSWPDDSGSVLVVGGAVMEVDWDRPHGSRLVSIEIAGAPLDDDRVYTVAMNSYLPGCTEEYPMFGDMELVSEWGTCEEALRALVSSEGWERVVAESGSTTYVEGAEPAPAPDPEPAPGPEPEPEEPRDEADAAEPVPVSVASSASEAALPQTGDALAIAPLALAAAGALGGALGAALASRRRYRA